MKTSSSANPILTLALRALSEQWTDERMEQELQELVGAGLDLQSPFVALESIRAIRPDEPGGGCVIALVGQLCAKLLEGAEVEGAESVEVAGAVLLQTANLLLVRYDAESVALAIKLLTQARGCFAPNSSPFGLTLMNEASARLTLAELRAEPAENLQPAVKLYRQARGCFEPNTPDFGRTLMNEATVWLRLARLGENPVQNLQQAVRLYSQACGCFAPNSPDFGNVLMNEATARENLAELGAEPGENLQQAVRLYVQSRGCFVPNGADFGKALMNEASARESLAELGENPAENLQQALSLCGQARGCFVPNSPDFGNALMNEAVVRVSLAESGAESADNLQQAVRLYSQARGCVAANSSDFGRTLMNEAAARLRLAELGTGPAENLQQTVSLSAQARGCFAPSSWNFGFTLMNEATARLRLAELGAEPGENLQQAVRLYGESHSCFASNSPAFGNALMSEATARVRLAELDADPAENLQQALSLYGQARGCFIPSSPDFGHALMNEAGARLKLAEILGVEPARNLEKSVVLFAQARGCFTPDTSDWATCQRNHAHALRTLAQREPEQRIVHLQSAQRLLREGLRVLESVRTQMRRERERIGFLETVSAQYAAMVQVCLDLADGELNPEQAEANRWEAWHWIHHGKSRTLLELLSTEQPRLKESDRPLREEVEARAKELDDAERALRKLRKELGGDEGNARGILSDPQTQPRLRQMTETLERAYAAHGAARQRLLERLETSGPHSGRQVPQPREALSGLAALTAPDSRTLLVEFFMLGGDEAVAFLVPTWRKQAPRPVRLALPHGRVAELAVVTLMAADTLVRTTRATRRYEISRGPTIQEERAAREAFQDLPDALGTLLAPERVDAVPRSWFDALTENPQRLPVEALPFDQDARRHLAACQTCREAALGALEQRAQTRWTVLCPEGSALSAWLRGGVNAELEAHLRACKLCAAQTKRTAWLAHGAGLLSREQVEAKLEFIEPPRATVWESFVGWLVQHFLLTEDERRAVAGWRLLVGGRRATRTTREELKERLAGDDSVTLSRPEDVVRWLFAQRQGNSVVIQVGASAAEKRQRFHLIFRRDDTVVHSLTTQDGRLCLTEEDFARARAAGANGFEIEDVEG